MLVVVEAVTSLFLGARGARSAKPPWAPGYGRWAHRVLVIVAWTLPPVTIFSASIVTMNSSGWLACGGPARQAAVGGGRRRGRGACACGAPRRGPGPAPA